MVGTTWKSSVKSVGSKLETLSISGHRNNNSKNNGYTVLEPGGNRVMSYDMLKDMPHDEFVAMITDRLDGKDISLAAESNSKRNPGVAGAWMTMLLFSIHYLKMPIKLTTLICMKKIPVVVFRRKS